jgi:hypothetical protein
MSSKMPPGYDKLLVELASLRSQLEQQQTQITLLQGLPARTELLPANLPASRRSLLKNLAVGLFAAGGTVLLTGGSAQAADITVNGDVVFSSTGSIALPIGTTAERPTSNRNGQMRFNTSLNLIEASRDGVWSGLGISPFRGALVFRSTVQTIPYGTPPPTAIIFQSASYDTNQIFSQANPTRLTVPAGVSKVRVSGNIRYGDPGVSTIQAGVALFVRKGGLNFIAMPRQQLPLPANGASGAGMNITSPVYQVTPGEYFELLTAHSLANSNSQPISWDTDTSQSITWFAMEIIE